LPVETIDQLIIRETSRNSKNTTKNGDTITTISNDDWCYKCRKFFENCQEVASKVGIVVVEGLF
jgi:hypothetical protein